MNVRRTLERPKKKDKSRKTFQKYGKFTQKSIRIKQELMKNKQNQNNSDNSNKQNSKKK